MQRSLTSEHTLFAAKRFSVEGRESCGAGVVLLSERSPPSSRGSSVTRRGSAQTYWKHWSRVPVSRSRPQEETLFQRRARCWGRQSSPRVKLSARTLPPAAPPPEPSPGWKVSDLSVARPAATAELRAAACSRGAPAGSEAGGWGCGGARLGGDGGRGPAPGAVGARGCGARAPCDPAMEQDAEAAGAAPEPEPAPASEPEVGAGACPRRSPGSGPT